MEEIWKPVKFYKSNVFYDFTDFYEVSNLGRVRALDRIVINKKGVKVFKKGCILKPHKNNRGYDCVNLWLNNNCNHVLVHRLVGFAFILNPENKPEIDHVIPVSNGGTNEATNLRWVYKIENRNNEQTIKNTRGSGDKRSIPIIFINNDGKIKYYEGMRECERDGFGDHGMIKKYCKYNSQHEIPLLNRKGYTWYYVDDYIIKFLQIKIEN